ncbi:MAG: GIY-YIG nuclease family protein [Planctomycetes bacterium]|nr:GIY-YIG nuclease family protein [Planctomycetota bacterium]
MAKPMWVYIMTNKSNTTIYTGVTNSLHRRVHEHRTGKGSSFIKRYKIRKLVYYEFYEKPQRAIEREKQIKGGSRKTKIQLIETVNPQWEDLYDEQSADITPIEA